MTLDPDVLLGDVQAALKRPFAAEGMSMMFLMVHKINMNGFV